MPATWYYGIDNQQKVPFYAQQILNLNFSGVVRLDTLVWRQGQADWQPLSAVLDKLRAEVAAHRFLPWPWASPMASAVPS